MRAWQANELGEPDDILTLAVVGDPEPGEGQVGIDVERTGLTFPDLLMCRGAYQVSTPFPFTPGGEVVGRVATLGAGVDRFEVGQRVLANCSGGLAERTTAGVGTTFAIADDIDAGQATALLVNYCTSYFALYERADLAAGETVLVNAAAGGVGSAAVQLALAQGARVIATAGSPEKVQVCKDLGADVAIDYRETPDFVELVREATDGKGVDVCFDPVGGDTFDRSRRCMGWDGRLLVIGFTSGRIADAPTNHILLKNYSVVGVHWGASLMRDPASLGRQVAALLSMLDDGSIDPPVFEPFAFEDAPAALTQLGERGTWGKVSVRIA